jgi:hypothetical protein
MAVRRNFKQQRAVVKRGSVSIHSDLSEFCDRLKLLRRLKAFKL